LGSFKALSNNFKKIFYSLEEMLKSEIYCLQILNYNISIISSKQYYDIFCFIGFIFKDELTMVEDVNVLYENGNDILKEFVSDFQSTYFSNVEIAFSVVRYLREFHLLEKIKNRINILESIFELNFEMYQTAWEYLKKLKNFFPCSKTSNISLKKNFELNSPIIKNTIDYNYIEFNRSRKFSDNVHETNCTSILPIGDLDNPNSIQFKESRVHFNKNDSSEKNRKILTSSSKKNSISDDIFNLRSTSITKENITTYGFKHYDNDIKDPYRLENSINFNLSNLCKYNIPKLRNSLIIDKNQKTKSFAEKNKLDNNFEEKINSESKSLVINKFNQQLKSISSVKLVSIDSKIILDSYIRPEKKNMIRLNKEVNLRDSTKELNKVNFNQISNDFEGNLVTNTLNNDRKNLFSNSNSMIGKNDNSVKIFPINNLKENLENKVVKIAAPLRRSSKIIEPNYYSNKVEEEFKIIKISKGSSYDNLPKVSISNKRNEINKLKIIKSNPFKIN